MNRAAAAAVLIAALAAGTAPACGPRRVSGPAQPGARDLIVLLPDPGGTTVGRATVSTPSGTVELAAARDATDVSAGAPPSPPRTLADADVQRIFGDTLAALPPSADVFTLQFQFQSDELTDASRQLLPEILRAVGARPAPDVMVVGHTDTTGPAPVNRALGLRRANAIRNLLIETGVDGALVEVTSHGEEDLLVPTDDEVSEPRNRRVEIAIR